MNEWLCLLNVSWILPLPFLCLLQFFIISPLSSNDCFAMVPLYPSLNPGDWTYSSFLNLSCFHQYQIPRSSSGALFLFFLSLSIWQIPTHLWRLRSRLAPIRSRYVPIHRSDHTLLQLVLNWEWFCANFPQGSSSTAYNCLYYPNWCAYWHPVRRGQGCC